MHQLAVPRGGTSSIGMSERSRGSTGEWGEWVAIPTRAEITALNNSLTNLKLTAVIPNTVVAVGDSVSITANSNNTHNVYILIGGTWNHSFISAVFPNNGNAPIIRNLAMYRESFDEFRIEAKDAWGLTITNTSNVPQPILVYRIEKYN